MNKRYFRSRKDPLFGIIILGAAAALLVILLNGLLNLGRAGAGNVITLILLALFVVLLLWIWFGTYYCIKNRQLYMRFGPFRGKVPIGSIHTLLCGTTMWSGCRPALARQGIIVKFNKYDEVYISPESNVEFVQVLTELNPGIKVIQKNIDLSKNRKS